MESRDAPTSNRGAACSRHPARAAEQACGRCGDFVCEGCLETIFERRVCPPCRQVDGVDVLEAFRNAVWGKRDAFVWVIGIAGSLYFGLTSIGLGLAIARSSAFEGLGLAFAELFALVGLATSVGYLCLSRRARRVLTFAPRVILGVIAASVIVGAPLKEAALLALAVSVTIPAVWLLHRSSRNRLAFRIAIDERDLERLIEANNRPARFGLALAVLGLGLPPLLPVALVLGVLGLRRVDPDGWPPVGGRRAAALGTGIAACGLLGWIGLGALISLA